MGGALAFPSRETPVVELALSIASITYGGLLGAFIMAEWMRRATGRDAATAILSATAVMLIVVLLKPGPLADLAWPWYVPLGTTVTVAVGFLSGSVRRRAGR